MPNLILVRGSVPKDVAETAFQVAWHCIVDTCRQWVESNVTQTQTYYWQREWSLWAKYAWEFFAETGCSIPEARKSVLEKKRSRNWTGVNWTGESSTLSGADGIAWPKLGYLSPKDLNYPLQKTEIEAFYQTLSQTLGQAFIEIARLKPTDRAAKAIEYGSAFVDPDEELSIPELVKRLVTHRAIAEQIQANYQPQVGYDVDSNQLQSLTKIADELNPDSFSDLNRLKRKRKKANQPQEPEYWTGWFMGDGDNAGKYLANSCHSDQGYKEFSQQMREWGLALKDSQGVLPGDGRMVYAGGDDFLGVLYRKKAEIQPEECLAWFSTFKAGVWDNPNPSQTSSQSSAPKPITVSVGFVWAAPKVPQRDVLQHCREAEKAAKQHGKDRIAFRILFNGGNHLQWVCPWWLLAGDFSEVHGPDALDPSDMQSLRGLMQAYDDPSWTHIYNNIAVLAGRHAFFGNQIDVALGIIEVYFGKPYRQILGDPSNWWNRDDANTGKRLFSGILGDPQRYISKFQPSERMLEQLNQHEAVRRDFNNWVVNLAKVGFHLNTSSSIQNVA
jgi:CRISPR-associated protein Cmr2